MSLGDAPAFPEIRYDHQNMARETVGGMTLRQYYAGLAMQGFIAAYAGDNRTPNPIHAASEAVEYADSLIAALEKL